MQIKTFAQLSKIADICRKKGIESIKITEETVEFTLKDEISKRKRTKINGKKAHAQESDDGAEATDAPSEEEMLFWSSAGIPETSGQG